MKGDLAMNNYEIERILKEENSLKPNDLLKEKVLQQAQILMEEEQKQKKVYKFSPVKLLSLVACIVIFLAVTLTCGLLYIDDYQTLYMDINPSISLNVNVYGTVNKVEFYGDSIKLKNEINVKGKSVEKAVEYILNVYDKKDILNDADIFFSVKKDKNSNLLDKVCKKANQYSEKKGLNFKVYKKDIGKEEMNNAKKYNISPAKYSLIMEIISLDNSYTIEDLKNKSMKELNQMIKNLK